jgi:hypothetical protein
MGGASSKVKIKSDNSEILEAIKTIQQKLKEMRQEKKKLLLLYYLNALGLQTK